MRRVLSFYQLMIELSSHLVDSSKSSFSFAGYIHETLYGREFDVTSITEPNNIAYSSKGLELHQVRSEEMILKRSFEWIIGERAFVIAWLRCLCLCLCLCLSVCVCVV